MFLFDSYSEIVLNHLNSFFPYWVTEAEPILGCYFKLQIFFPEALL